MGRTSEEFFKWYSGQSPRVHKRTDPILRRGLAVKDKIHPLTEASKAKGKEWAKGKIGFPFLAKKKKR